MKQAAWKRQIGFSYMYILRLSLFTTLFLPYTSCNREARVYKDGDVILGGLFDIHFAGYRKDCGDLYMKGLGETIPIESINKNPSLLPNATR